MVEFQVQLSNLGVKNDKVWEDNNGENDLISMESFSSSSSKEGDESFIWSSVDLPSLDMFFSGSN